ncbi:MAG: TVP38/TMEM64 family protein [Candidatus Binataceae bacterium]
MAAATRFRAPAGPHKRFLTAINLLRFAILAIIIVGIAYLLLGHSEWFEDPARVKLEIMAYGIWGPVVFIVLYAVGPSFLVPGAVMTIAGGLAFGAVWGAIYSFIGADIGAVVAFGAGRFLGHGFVARMVSGRFHPLLEKIARHGFQIIFYLRVVPLIPYNALNLLAGASPIRFHDYFWATRYGIRRRAASFSRSV